MNFAQQRKAAAARNAKISNAASSSPTNPSLNSQKVSVSWSKGTGGTDVTTTGQQVIIPNKAYTTVKQGSLGGTSKS